MIRINGQEFPTESIELSMDSVFTITTTEPASSFDDLKQPNVEVEIETDGVTYGVNTSDYAFTFDNGTITLAYVDKEAKMQSEIDALKSTVAYLQSQLDELLPWTTYATGENGHGTVVNDGCNKSGRIVDITQTETPPKDAEKRFVIAGYHASGYTSQYEGNVTIPMDKATLCQGIRPGFWDGDIFIEVGGVGAQMIYGKEGDGQSTYTIDFDTIEVQYKGE